MFKRLKRKIKQGPYAIRDLYFGKGRFEAKFQNIIEFFPKRVQPQPGKMLRLLYCKGPYDYSEPRRGISAEEISFLHTLINMPIDVIRIDPDKNIKRFGRKGFVEILKEVAYWYSPDVAFFSEMNDKYIEAIQYISDQTETVTFNWTCDDQWAFDNYTGPIAKYFNYVVTTDPEGIKKYESIKYRNALHGMWGCNHFLFRPLSRNKILDIVFIGQIYGYREDILRYLKKNGIKVSIFGFGAKAGRLTFSEMVKVISGAKICLNFSGGSDGKTLQIKSRNFEVPGCGTLLLTEYVPGIEKYYEIGTEIDCWRKREELLEKVQTLLMERNRVSLISKAGYKRTIREHTYIHRFCDLFEIMNVENARNLRQICIDFNLLPK